MEGLLRAVRQLGLRKLLQLRRARSWGWEGLLRGHVLTRVVQTLLDTGLFDAMRSQGAVDVKVFARTHELDQRLLTAMCDYLAGRRLLRKADSNGSYMLDDDGAFLMQSDAVRGWMELVHGYEEVLHALPDMLAGRRHYRVGDVQRDGEHVAVGSGRASVGFFFPLTADTIRRGGYRRVLDIGCGDATFLRYLCRAVPGVEGVGIDLSEAAVRAAEAQIAAEGLSDRVKVICGDAFRLGDYRTELAGVDAATSFFVLHELCGSAGDGPLMPFLQTFRCALPNVPLIAIDAIRPTVEQMRRRPGPALEYSLLHDLSGQKTLARGAWRDVFIAAGFADVHEEHFDFARASIISAAAPPPSLRGGE
jgi:SAM-dependent methyltransferase